MPIGGANGIGWDESSPSVTESAGLGANRIQSLETSLRQGLDSEHNWPSAGGNAVGYHRYGSARPYYGPQSAVSSSGSDGRLMLASDTSQLFGVGSGGTLYLGGPTVISLGTFPGGLPQRAQWVEEVGLVRLAGISFPSSVVTIPNSGYSGVPYVWLTQNELSGNTNTATFVGNLMALGISATTFAVFGSGQAGASGFTIAWRSLGTRTL